MQKDEMNVIYFAYMNTVVYSCYGLQAIARSYLCLWFAMIKHLALDHDGNIALGFAFATLPSWLLTSFCITQQCFKCLNSLAVQVFARPDLMEDLLVSFT